jgi:hypothetical protein
LPCELADEEKKRKEKRNFWGEGGPFIPELEGNPITFLPHESSFLLGVIALCWEETLGTMTRTAG